MINFFKRCVAYTLSIVGIVFTIIPEAFFESYKLNSNWSNTKSIIINRIIVILAILALSILFYALLLSLRNSVSIKGKNYCIKVKYGNIFDMKRYKKVIPFDECFTTIVGDKPSDINPDSICGQYLIANPIQDMQSLINSAELKPARSKSKYKSMDRYDSGTLLQKEDYLLLSFGKLTEDGLCRMTRDEYMDCLSLLWKEINKYYGQKNICIPILGSGVTRMAGETLTQQELLDIIIESYKLSCHKIKLPNKLCIVCKRQDGFSINKIGENL